jgi:hypothetical protein
MSAASQFDTFRRRIGMAAIIYGIVVVVLGSSVSIATGEWIAFVCAIGFVIVPVGSLALRSRHSSR